MEESREKGERREEREEDGKHKRDNSEVLLLMKIRLIDSRM